MSHTESGDSRKNAVYDPIQIAEDVCFNALQFLEKVKNISNLRKVARDAIARADQLVEQIKQKIPPQRPIACRQGCPFCCRMFRTHVTAIEAIQITGFIVETLDAPSVKSLMNRIAALDRKTKNMNMHERAVSHLACAFLADDRCLVYPVRPLRCRAYNSLDAQSCRTIYETGNLETTIDYYYPQREIPFLVQTGLRAASQACGCDSAILDLTSAMRIALGGKRRAAEEWLNGKPIFSPAHVKE